MDYRHRRTDDEACTTGSLTTDRQGIPYWLGAQAATPPKETRVDRLLRQGLPGAREPPLVAGKKGVERWQRDKAFTDDQARTVFLTLILTGVRRSELQALRWADVDLVDDVLRVRDSKSEDGIRSVALSTTLAEELWQHRRCTRYQGDGERVFCQPERGTIYRAEAFQDALRAALSAAGVEGHVRAFHDLRHTAITNDAAAGANPVALMTKAGHANMKTNPDLLAHGGRGVPRRGRTARGTAARGSRRGALAGYKVVPI